ncbi:hypothetical protein Hdeb2414_s0017g00504941 [Helianthus debilis subsp. tardiflorus]
MAEKLDVNESIEKDNTTENLDDENNDKVDGLQSLDTKLDRGTISTSTEGVQFALRGFCGQLTKPANYGC